MPSSSIMSACSMEAAPGPNGVLNSLGGVGMCCHSQAEVAGFIHRSIEFFRREFERTRIAAVGQHCAGGEDFDHIHPVVGQLSEFSAELPMDCWPLRSADPKAAGYREPCPVMAPAPPVMVM